MNAQERIFTRNHIRIASEGLLLLATLSLSGCSGSVGVGVGVSVGVPVGSHGYMSVGGSRWY